MEAGWWGDAGGIQGLAVSNLHDISLPGNIAA